MEIRWSLPAADDLERICRWIERDNPEAASEILLKDTGACDHMTPEDITKPFDRQFVPWCPPGQSARRPAF